MVKKGVIKRGYPFFIFRWKRGIKNKIHKEFISADFI